jgi:hypothetical protein
MSKVKIISDGVKTKVFIDDKVITRVTALKICQNAAEIPTLTLQIAPENIEIDGKNIPIKFAKDRCSFTAENIVAGKLHEPLEIEGLNEFHEELKKMDESTLKAVTDESLLKFLNKISGKE